jgi:uncharacterized protein YciW
MNIRPRRIPPTCSPLASYAAFREILEEGRLTKALRAQIAVGLSDVQPCPRCRRVRFEQAVEAGIAPSEIAQNRSGRSSDDRVQAALDFARFVATSDGDIGEEQFASPRAQGFDDADIAEMIALTALHLVDECLLHAREQERGAPP